MGSMSEKLHKAINDNDVETVRKLIAKGVDVNDDAEDEDQKEDVWEMPALNRAVMGVHANPEIVRLLLDAGADVNVENEDTYPIHSAAGGGNVEICRMLIDAGANVSAKDEDEETPLFKAAHDGHVDVCRLLIEKGADVSAVSDTGGTALHNAASGAQPEVCRYLVSVGAAFNAIANDGATPLALAAEFSGVDACRALVELGSSPSFAPEKPWDNYLTPFQVAVAGGNEEVIRYFVMECGEDLHQKSISDAALEELPRDEIKPKVRQILNSLKTEMAVLDAVNQEAKNEVGEPKKRPSGQEIL